MKNYEIRYVKNGECLFWLGNRPEYCNRGRFHTASEGIAVAQICTKHHRSDADPPNRYYFNVLHGMEEMLRWAIAHGVACSGGKWYKYEFNAEGGGENCQEINGPTPETLSPLPEVKLKLGAHECTRV